VKRDKTNQKTEEESENDPVKNGAFRPFQCQPTVLLSQGMWDFEK